MKRKYIPKNKFIRPKSRFKACRPGNGVRGFVEAFFSLYFFFYEEAVLSACPCSFFSKDHYGGYRFVIAEDHPLAGHGNTGKVAALVSAGFCYKEKFSGRKAAAQVGFQLPAAENDSVFYFIVRICIRPRVEDIFRMIFCERFDKILYGFVYHLFSNLKWYRQ